MTTSSWNLKLFKDMYFFPLAKQEVIGKHMDPGRAYNVFST